MENTQSIMIKRLAALMVAVFVVVMLSVPSFAYTDNSTNNVDFTNQPVPVAEQGMSAYQKYEAGLSVYSDWAVIADYSSTDDIYVCINGTRIYFFSESQNQTLYILHYLNQNTTLSNSYSTTSFVPDAALYYNSYNTSIDMTDSTDIPVFTGNIQTMAGAVRDWIDNPPVTSQPLSLALQPGNVAYIDITNTNATITLTQHTSVAYWQLTSTQYIGASNSLPSSGFTVPIAGTGMIDWVGVGRKTVQGQYNDWTSTQVISGSASDHQHVYAIVVNPLQNNVTTGSGLDVSSVANGIINISVNPAWSVKIYQLENQFSLGVDSNTQSGDTGTGTYDSNTGQWNYTNDQTGESFEQQYGGMTTPESQFDSIHDFLENIANTISGFFSGAINAVSTLVGAGSSFFGVLGGLYSWLPPAVYSVLVSALIIVITIGVIKVFV